MAINENVFNQDYTIDKSARRLKNGHGSFLILLTGLSGSGKSVIANKLERELFSKGIKTYALDGDNIRLGICNDLGFSAKDRIENLRRIGEIANLMIEAGIVTIAAFVSPYQKSRQMIREIVGSENFVEVHVNTSLETCEKRDVKGLYAKARRGEIADFTGISSPYEVPTNPDLTLDTENSTPDDAVRQILEIIQNKLSLKP
jgi:adenylylsulfate kinase